MVTYFENLNVKLYVIYVLKHMLNFMSIRGYLLFNYFLCIILDNKNSKFKDLSDDITIDIWSFWKFSCIEDLIRKFNPMVDLLKFAFNKNILSGVVVLIYNQVCC